MTTDGKSIYVVGGTSGTALADMEVYDPQSKNWRSVSSLPTPTCLAGGVYLPWGKIVVVGGRDACFAGNPRDTIYVYDILNNSWSLSNVRQFCTFCWHCSTFAKLQSE